MIEQQLRHYLAKKGEERRQGHLEALILSIGTLPPPPGDTLAKLASTPRLSQQGLSIDEALWPLQVLSMPSAERFDELQARVEYLSARIDSCASRIPEGAKQEAVEAAKENVKLAYRFLRWPQNRERVANALQLFCELRPDAAGPTPIDQPTMFEKFLLLLHRVLVRWQEDSLRWR